jgi:L-alanine-DL-glutamate epimerase-like enolase superfamily enzyme
LVELLDKLKEKHPHIYDSIIYIEQPTKRDLENYAFTLHEVSKRKPVLLNESLDSLDSLRYLDPLGWSGVALKTCKGQSAALIGYCWAMRRGVYITVQDLTNPGLACVHSANLAGHLRLSSDAFECNTRKYAPDSCPEETAQYSEMFIARNGKLPLDQIRGQGLY